MLMTLKALVSNSGLSQQDKDLWFSILEKIDEFQIKVLEDSIEGKEENLKLLTENLKAKTEALKNLDEKAIEEIVEHETALN